MVANKERGEVALTVLRRNGDGVEEEREYVLKMGLNSVVALQQKLKKPLAQIVAELDKLDMETARHLAFMFLQKYHAAEVKTLEQAGDVVDDAGGPMNFFMAFKALMELNKPPEGDKANPQTAQTTTGGDSTSALAASV